ncbi:MAG: ABC transporter substrate-binding protein [Amylibacter sp.]|jgi:phospholipid transport system substrate-binding protein|nr:ABC transporter substrate-binding protein [Amylibacter sp.]
MQTNLFTRRAVMAMMAALPMAGPALALSQSDAESLIGKLTGEIFRVINAGKSESAMFRDFERIFAKYADVPVIARSSLGVARRSASKSQINAYTKAFQGYVSRKYGKRFRKFIGAEILVTKSQKSKRGYLVDSSVTFKGKRPFLVQWQVSDASGRDKMFDIIIEGISMLRLEREEIGAMLDRRGGDIDKLIAHLKTAS